MELLLKHNEYQYFNDYYHKNIKLFDETTIQIIFHDCIYNKNINSCIFLLDNFWDFLKEEVTCKNKPLLFSSILFSSINKQINNYQFTSIEDLKQFEIDTINEICPNNDNPKLVEIKQLGYELINYINNKIN